MILCTLRAIIVEKKYTLRQNRP